MEVVLILLLLFPCTTCVSVTPFDTIPRIAQMLLFLLSSLFPETTGGNVMPEGTLLEIVHKLLPSTSVSLLSLLVPFGEVLSPL